MREDWALIDFARAFMPDWLAKFISMKTVAAVTLALILFVVVLKMAG